jgi:peptidoglycan/LPS O-acetylase OafA/YrhL
LGETASSKPSVGSAFHGGASYRPDIDGLRAIAIISVVAFHVRLAFFRGGFVGVDVFLVISGYLIGSLVYRDVRESKFSFLHFYERRAKRILPALLVVLFVCNLIAFLLLSPLELKDYSAQSFSAVVSSSNIFYWLRSNYFSPVSALKPLLMTWSLGIEEQFYLLFPLGLFLLHKFARRQVFRWVAIASALSFACCVVCVTFYPAAAFYLLPMRAWELGLGVLIAIYEVQHGGPVHLGQTATNLLGWLGLALIVAPVTYSEGARFPGFAAALPTLGTVCLINARQSFVNRRLLASPPMVFVGLISYSWYLWHWPLLSFARIVSGDLLTVPRASLIAVVSLLLAIFSHRFIEQPFRRSVTPTPRLLAGYATLVVLLAAIPLIGYVKSGWPLRTPELAKVEAAVSAVEKNPCLAGFEESKPRLRTPCVVEGSGPKLALLGDSHAASLGAAVQQLAATHGYGFEQLTKASCPPLADVAFRWALHPTFERTCAAFNRTVLQRVLSDKSIRVVVLAGFWAAPWTDGSKQDCYSNSSQSGQAVSEAGSYSNLHSGLLKAITLLRSSGKRVFVATDVPRFEPDPMANVRNSVMSSRGQLAALLSPYPFSLNPVDERSLITRADAITDSEVRQAASEGGAQIIDLARNLCPGSSCSFWNNGVLLYSDSQHLTPAGAEYALQGQDPISATLEEQTVALTGNEYPSKRLFP